MIEQPVELWNQALSELELQITKSSFDTWLRGTVSFDAEDNELIVLVKNEYAVNWLGHRFITPILRTLRRLTENEDIAVRFVVSELWPPQMEDPSTPNASGLGMSREGGKTGAHFAGPVLSF